MKKEIKYYFVWKIGTIKENYEINNKNNKNNKNDKNNKNNNIIERNV